MSGMIDNFIEAEASALSQQWCGPDCKWNLLYRPSQSFVKQTHASAMAIAHVKSIPRAIYSALLSVKTHSARSGKSVFGISGWPPGTLSPLKTHGRNAAAFAGACGQNLFTIALTKSISALGSKCM
jgi:hypothetical protein